MSEGKTKLRVDTSLRMKLGNCYYCIFCHHGLHGMPVHCEAAPGNLDDEHRLDDVRQLDEHGNCCRTPPDWCPLRRGKVIVEGEE